MKSVKTGGNLVETDRETFVMKVGLQLNICGPESFCAKFLEVLKQSSGS